jgi:hypothetical protein
VPALHPPPISFTARHDVCCAVTNTVKPCPVRRTPASYTAVTGSRHADSGGSSQKSAVGLQEGRRREADTN